MIKPKKVIYSGGKTWGWDWKFNKDDPIWNEIDFPYHHLTEPARVWTDQDGKVITQEWWFKGKQIPVQSQEEFEKYIKLMSFE